MNRYPSINVKGLISPYVMPNVKHVFHQYTIKVTEDSGMPRDELKKRLGAFLHRYPAMRRLLKPVMRRVVGN